MSAPRRASLQSLLARRPAALAWALQRRMLIGRVISRVRSTALYWVALFGALILVGVAFTYLYRSASATDWFQWLARHRLMLSAAGAVYAALAVSRRRAHLQIVRDSSWLAATPLANREYSMLAIVRIGTSSFAEWLGATVVIAVLGLGTSFESAVQVLIAVSAGFAVGIIVGALLPTRRSARFVEYSRYVFKRSTSAPAVASFTGLSRWPIAAALAWHRPENSRWLFIAAALSVPAGSSALLGLAILTVATLASYLFALARSFPSVAREAANWLRPTMIGFPQFAYALVRRMFVHQVVGSAILGGVLLLIGADFSQAVSFASFWLALVLMTVGIAARQSFQAESSVVRLLLSTAIVAVAEIRARGFGVGIAAVILLMHMPRASNARA